MNALKNERGAALVVVMIALFVISLLSGALWQYSMFDTMHTIRQEKEMRAFYLARAGAEAAMAAWQKTPALQTGSFQSKEVYLDTENGEFKDTLPAKPGGYYTVKIENIAIIDADNKDTKWTEVIATGVVDGYYRTVTLITQPFVSGHSLTPKWYNEIIGIISAGNYDTHNRYVSVIPNSSEISLQTRSNSSDVEASFNAGYLRFEKPLVIDIGNVTGEEIHFILVGSFGGYNKPLHNKTLNASAEVVEFSNITLTHLPRNVFLLGLALDGLLLKGKSAQIGSLILCVPAGGGIDGKSIGGNQGERYGKVLFKGDVKTQNYEWKRNNYLAFSRYYIQAKSKQDTRNSSGEKLAGNAYYFRHGTDLLSIKAGDLIMTDATDDDLRLYFWK